MHPFEIFLQFFLPPPCTKLKLRKKFWIHASNVVCEGRGWACMNWKTPQKCTSVQRILSMIEGGRNWSWSLTTVVARRASSVYQTASRAKTFIRGPLLNKVKQPRWWRQWELPKRQYIHCFHFSVCLNKVFPLTSLILWAVSQWSYFSTHMSNSSMLTR